jgi:hypothetical protein
VIVPRTHANKVKRSLVRSACRVILTEVGYARRGQGARISFPEALQLANRCWCGSDARFCCQRPDWLRVPNFKHRQTCLRVSRQRPDWLRIPNFKHRQACLRVSLPAPRLAPSPKLQVPAHPAPRHRPNYRRRPLAPVRLSRKLIRRPPQSHRRPAAPDILIVVNKPTQTMTVTVDGHVRYRWRVSTGATQYSTPDRVLHSVSYGAYALFAGVGQRWYAARDLFHQTRSQHSWFGQSWPWHRSISWVRSSHPFTRSHPLPTRRVGRHGENKGCRQWT